MCPALVSVALAFKFKRSVARKFSATAFRMALFFGHISVSLYGKSWPPPTGFHTFYVVHILITTCWVSSTCSKIGPARLDPARSLACSNKAFHRRENKSAVPSICLYFCVNSGIRRARSRPSTSYMGARRRLVRRGDHHRDALRPKAPVQHACGTQRGWVRLG